MVNIIYSCMLMKTFIGKDFYFTFPISLIAKKMRNGKNKYLNR